MKILTKEEEREHYKYAGPHATSSFTFRHIRTDKAPTVQHSQEASVAASPAWRWAH